MSDHFGRLNDAAGADMTMARPLTVKRMGGSPAQLAEAQPRHAPDHVVVRALAVNWLQRVVATLRAEASIRDACRSHLPCRCTR